MPSAAKPSFCDSCPRDAARNPTLPERSDWRRRRANDLSTPLKAHASGVAFFVLPDLEAVRGRAAPERLTTEQREQVVVRLSAILEPKWVSAGALDRLVPTFRASEEKDGFLGEWHAGGRELVVGAFENAVVIEIQFVHPSGLDPQRTACAAVAEAEVIVRCDEGLCQRRWTVEASDELVVATSVHRFDPPAEVEEHIALAATKDYLHIEIRHPSPVLSPGFGGQRSWFAPRP